MEGELMKYKSKQSIHADCNKVEVFLSKIEDEYDSGVCDIDVYNQCLLNALLVKRLQKRLSEHQDVFDKTANTNFYKEVEKHFPNFRRLKW